MRVDLRAEVTRDRVLAGFLALLQWWWLEITDLVPTRWRQWVKSSFERRVIRLDGQIWRIGPGSGAHDGLALDMKMPDHALRDLIARVDPSCRNRRLDAVIPEADGLLRHISLPVAAGQRLRAVVGLQMDRLSPFRAADVRFDCRKAANVENGMMNVEVAMVPKATLLAYEEMLKNIGLAVGRFRFADTGLSFARVKSGLTAHERVQLGLAGLAAVLWLGAIVVIPISRDAEIARLSSDVASLRVPAARALADRAELLHLQAPVAAASARQRQLDALDVLLAVTRALPDDAQLSSLSFQQGRIEISGRAEDAGYVAASLNQSGYLHGARVAKTNTGGTFEIEVTPQPLTRKPAP